MRYILEQINIKQDEQIQRLVTLEERSKHVDQVYRQFLGLAGDGKKPVLQRLDEQEEKLKNIEATRHAGYKSRREIVMLLLSAAAIAVFSTVTTALAIVSHLPH